MKLARAGQLYASGAEPRMRRMSKSEREIARSKYPTFDGDTVHTESHNKPPPVPEPVPEPEPAKKQKPSRGKRESNVHPLFRHVKDLIFRYYRNRIHVDPPWGAGEAKQLSALLSESSDATEEYWNACMVGRSESDVNHAERPRLWLANLPNYRNPVNAYNRPKGGKSKPVFVNALEQQRQREQGANA